MCFFKKRKQRKEEERLATEQAEKERLEQERLAKEKAEQEAKEKEKKASAKAKKETKQEEVVEEVEAVEEVSQKAEESTDEITEKKVRKAVYRVVFDKEDSLWKIKKDGAKRIITSYKTKQEALDKVQALSKNQEINFVVKKKDGKFQKKANLKLKSDKKEN